MRRSLLNFQSSVISYQPSLFHHIMVGWASFATIWSLKSCNPCWIIKFSRRLVLNLVAKDRVTSIQSLILRIPLVLSFFVVVLLAFLLLVLVLVALPDLPVLDAPLLRLLPDLPDLPVLDSPLLRLIRLLHLLPFLLIIFQVSFPSCCSSRLAFAFSWHLENDAFLL